MEFKDRLKQARNQNNLSQKELAQLIDVHVMNISRYERGENLPSTDILAKMARALKVTTDYLMNGAITEQAETTISDKELLAQFQKLEKLPTEKKNVIKEVIEAYILKATIQGLAS